MIHAWLALVFCLIFGLGAFVLGMAVEEDLTAPDDEGYYEIYTVSIVDTLGNPRNISGVKFISERNGYLTLYDTLDARYIISIRDNVDYIKCIVTDSVKRGEEKR